MEKNISDNPVFVGAYKLPKISLNANTFPDENEQYVIIFYFQKIKPEIYRSFATMYETSWG